jgi:hypothetical protein
MPIPKHRNTNKRKVHWGSERDAKAERLLSQTDKPKLGHCEHKGELDLEEWSELLGMEREVQRKR